MNTRTDTAQANVHSNNKGSASELRLSNQRPRRGAHRTIGCTIFALIVCASVVHGQLEIDWQTVDGGGRMNSAGGVFTLSGTIGQPDATSFDNPMTGGDFELAGGFWVIAAPTCGCLADVNGDGERDSLDLQGFVDCLIATGANCGCADVDGIAGVNLDDVAVFVQDLLTGASCP